MNSRLTISTVSSRYQYSCWLGPNQSSVLMPFVTTVKLKTWLTLQAKQTVAVYFGSTSRIAAAQFRRLDLIPGLIKTRNRHTRLSLLHLFVLWQTQKPQILKAALPDCNELMCLCSERHPSPDRLHGYLSAVQTLKKKIPLLLEYSLMDSFILSFWLESPLSHNQYLCI